MAFITDKEELKPGLIIFRRGDVTHRNFYCRVKLPKDDRYKTIALGTPDPEAARDRAFDHDADVRFRLKHDVPVFNRPFRQVAEEFIAVQQRRADTGEISAGRASKISKMSCLARSTAMSAAPRFIWSGKTAGLGIRHGGARMARDAIATISAMPPSTSRWAHSMRP